MVVPHEIGPPPKKNKLRRYPQQHAVLFLVLAPPRSPRRTSQNLVEPWWNPGGTLVEPYLRAAPDHPEAWAETQKSFQLGKKKRRGLYSRCSLPENLVAR